MHVRSSGACAEWYSKADATVKEVSKTVCGPLLEALTELIGHLDTQAPEQFREGVWLVRPSLYWFARMSVSSGAQLYGALQSNQGSDLADVHPVIPDLGSMWWQCAESNAELLGSLREDPNSGALHQLAWDDFEKGRMSKPVPVSSVDLNKVSCVSCGRHG